MNKLTKKIALVLIAGALLTACGEKEVTPEKEIIRMVKYEESTLNESGVDLRFSGSLKPAVESSLSFKIPGTIDKVYSKASDFVKKGQLLAVLDDSNYKLQLQQAEASYEQAKAAVIQIDSKIAEAKTGIAQAKTGILQASSAIAQAEAAHKRAASVKENAQQEFERYRELYLNDNIAQNIFDKAKSGLEQATSAVEQAEAAVAQAKAAHAQTLAMKEQAEAGLEQAKAGKLATEAQVNAVEKQVELAQLQLSYTELRAPLDGTIALQISEVNENVGAGMPIFRIDSGNQLEAEIYVSESVINKIKIGDTASITISSINKVVTGIVTEVGSSSTGFGGTYAVKVNVDKADANLKAGMAVEVKLKSEKRENYITLPLTAVNEASTGEKFVYVVQNINEGQGEIVKKEIIIGELVNNRLQVLSGIDENEKVVTAGVSRVVPGQKVRLYEEGK